MSLWIVTSGWLGNGMEGVIVEAETEAEAMDAAAAALTADAQANLDQEERRSPRPVEWIVKHETERIDSYQTREKFRAEAIMLPYLGEF